MGIGAFGNWRGCGEDVRDGVKLEARAVPVVGVGVALSLSRLLLPSGRFGERVGWCVTAPLKERPNWESHEWGY